jgi:hypothetical protein
MCLLTYDDYAEMMHGRDETDYPTRIELGAVPALCVLVEPAPVSAGACAEDVDF